MAATKDILQIDQADIRVPSWRALFVKPSLTWTVALQGLDLPNALKAYKQCNANSNSLVTCRYFLLFVGPILSLQCRQCQHCARDHIADDNEPGVVERLLSPLIDSLHLLGSGAGSYTSKPSSGGNSSSQSQSQESSGPPSKRKRPGAAGTKRDPEEPPDDDGDSSGAGAPSKHPAKGGEPRGLKCPFYQRRPEAHQRTSCKVITYPNMFRLRYHIQRVHTKPLQCDRCLVAMDSGDALKKHIKMDPPCENREAPIDDDRISQQLLKDVHLNRLHFSRATCNTKKWNLLYAMLFPGEVNMPECYEDPGMTAAEERRFLELLAQKIAAEFGDKVSERVSILAQECKQEMQGIKKQVLQSKIPDDVKTNLSPSYPDLSSNPWLHQAMNSASQLEAGASSQSASPQMYQMYPDLDPLSQGQMEWDHTSDHLSLLDWPEVSQGADLNLSEPLFFPKDEYQAEDRDEPGQGDRQVGPNGNPGGAPEHHTGTDEEVTFSAFVEYPPKLESPELEQRLEVDDNNPRDGG